MTNTAQDTPNRPEGDGNPRGQTAPRVRRRVRTTTSDRQRRKKLWTYGLLLLSAGLMVNALIGEKGYVANLQARRTFQEVSEALDQLKAENVKLEQDARRLQTDPQALEDSARSQLGLIKPGETLITLRDRPATRD